MNKLPEVLEDIIYHYVNESLYNDALEELKQKVKKRNMLEEMIHTRFINNIKRSKLHNLSVFKECKEIGNNNTDSDLGSDRSNYWYWRFNNHIWGLNNLLSMSPHYNRSNIDTISKTMLRPRSEIYNSVQYL